jgi:hypothetical protein
MTTFQITVRSICRLWTLNEEQARALTITGYPMLIDLINLRLQSLQRPQLARCHTSLYLMGGAGSGKSHVIKALRCLAVKWGYQEAVQCFSWPAHAAYLIDGRSLASSILSVKETESVATMWAMVVDEVSMLGCAQLVNVHQHVHCIKNTPYTPVIN